MCFSDRESFHFPVPQGVEEFQEKGFLVFILWHDCEGWEASEKKLPCSNQESV